MVNEYVPVVSMAVMPLSVAVPFWLSTKLTPLGSALPDSLNLGVGVPVVVTVKLPSVPRAKVVLLALVMAGGGSAANVSVKLLLAYAGTSTPPDGVRPVLFAKSVEREPAAN